MAGQDDSASLHERREMYFGSLAQVAGLTPSPRRPRPPALQPPLERLYLAASGAKAIALDVCTRPLASPDDCKKRLRPHLDAAARHALAVRAQLERTGVPEARWPDAEDALVIMCTEEALLAYEADKSDVEELMMMPTKSCVRVGAVRSSG